MALIKCPDCEKMISPRVQQCPFCGCPSDFFAMEAVDTILEQGETELDNNSLQNKDVESQGEVIVSQPESDNEIVFGLQTEQNPNSNKATFNVILDSDRETDKHPKGKTHVLFRIGNSKYLTVAKDNLFYAPIEQELDEKSYSFSREFKQYLDNVSTLSGLTTGARDKANGIMIEYCKFLVEKLLQYGVYEYDVKNFTSFCGSDILIEDTNAYESILNQENNVDSYAQNLEYQRNVERASRSQWQGGGFGVKGAIKGAVTAGAMNAATGAFRSIGDGITNASDKSNVQSKYNAIVNDKNKHNLFDDFSRGCLFRAKVNFYRILSKKTGWSAAEVLQENWDEANAKLNNLQAITDRDTQEKVLIELLSEHPYHFGVLEYAISNYVKYDFDFGDLLYFVKRISPDAFYNWLAKDFNDCLKNIEDTKSGEDRKKALLEFGVTVGVIDENYRLVSEGDMFAESGADLILSLIESDMLDAGFSIRKIEEQTKTFDKAQSFFTKLMDAGRIYHVFEGGDVGNKLEVAKTFLEYESFSKLQAVVNAQLEKICTVRDIICKDIKEAEVLTTEWKEFDDTYSPFDSYADYDSKEMQNIVNKLQDKGFKSQHVNDLISGTNGLISKKNKLEQREETEEYTKSMRVVELVKPYATDNLFVFGSGGFLEQAKKVREFDKIKEQENDIYPLIIYDASDSAGFKGFVLTDKYFYNYNSMLGIGFGDKAINLYDVRETVQNGKNRLFKLENGKTEKVKIIGNEELIVGALSEVFAWNSDLSRTATSGSVSDIGVQSKPMISDSTKEQKPCPICNSLIDVNAKFCTFCGNRIEETSDDKKTCPECGKLIKNDAKFCTFCGYSFNN